MALLDRTVALEDLLKGLGAESPVSGERGETPSGSVRAQPAQAAVARTVQRPATRPGYPPQLTPRTALRPGGSRKSGWACCGRRIRRSERQSTSSISSSSTDVTALIHNPGQWLIFRRFSR